MAFWYGERDGFTTNVVTGNDLDSRSAYSGKAQLLWAPASQFEAAPHRQRRTRSRRRLCAERPWRAARPTRFRPRATSKVSPSATSCRRPCSRDGTRAKLSLSTTTTGFVDWRTEDATDLDYLPLPLATRDNREESFQFTQEVRLASPATTPLAIADERDSPVAGAACFCSHRTTSRMRPTRSRLRSPRSSDSALDLSRHADSPLSELDDVGFGVYGQGTVTLGSRFDLIAGVRADYEQKDALLNTFTTPRAAVPSTHVGHRAIEVSPTCRRSLPGSIRLAPTKTVYGSLTRGFKAGGFNSASPIGSEAYDRSTPGTSRAGVKTHVGGRARDGERIGVPHRLGGSAAQSCRIRSCRGSSTSTTPAAAVSSGVEVEVMRATVAGIDVFGSFGYTHARFDEGVRASALTDVGGNEIPNTPDFTTTFGAQVSHLLRPGVTLYRSRARRPSQGAFHYDEANTERQDAYTLANFRAASAFGVVLVEAWSGTRSTQEYIPVAFEYRRLRRRGSSARWDAPGRSASTWVWRSSVVRRSGRSISRMSLIERGLESNRSPSDRHAGRHGSCSPSSRRRLSGSTPAAPIDWPQWRGPNRIRRLTRDRSAGAVAQVGTAAGLVRGRPRRRVRVDRGRGDRVFVQGMRKQAERRHQPCTAMTGRPLWTRGARAGR